MDKLTKLTTPTNISQIKKTNEIVDKVNELVDQVITDAERTKLNGIAAGANKTVVDTALSSTSTNPVQNKVVNTALNNKVTKANESDANGLINALSEGTAEPTDNDYFIAQYAGGGTTTKTYHRRPVSKLASYVIGKLKKVATSGAYSDLTGTPTSLKNPNALTIQLNGTSQGAYDGSSAKTINVTASSVGAAASSHTHNYAGSSSAGGAATTIARTLVNPSADTDYSIFIGTDGAPKYSDGIGVTVLQGTTSAAGYGSIKLGNPTKSGTAGNKQGNVQIYGTGAGYTNIKSANTSDANYNLTLPAKTGTVALTNDIPSSLPANGGTASKLGTATVGSATKPIYLNAGTPTAGTYTLGDACSKNVKNITTAGPCGWEDATKSAAYVPTINTMAYWDGSYNTSHNSNIKYTSVGTLGSAATLDTSNVVKSLSISGRTITVTKANNTTSTLTTQDNNTTYSAGRGISLSGTTFSNSAGIYFVSGTQTAATNAWTGAAPTGVTAYYDGLTIDYYLPYAGTSTAATLNLGSIGAKPVYVGSGTSAVTTHYPAGSLIHLTYLTGLNSGNGAWKASAYYNTNTTYAKGKYNYLGLTKPSKSYTGAATLTTSAAETSTAPTINAITTTASRYYAVEQDVNGVPFVNVPWVDTNTNTTYSAGTGISLSGTTFSNSGVRSIAAGSTANVLSVNTGGTTSSITINNVANATTATKVGSSTVGGTTTPIYLNAGTPTACSYTLAKSVPSNAVFTDTHYTTGLKVGASASATANAAASNGSVYLNVLDNTTVRDSHKIVGSGATTVTSDANGAITISSTNTNTTYSAGTGISLSGTTFSNSGVRSVTAGSSANQITVNTGGTSSTITVNNVANATNATNATKAITFVAEAGSTDVARYVYFAHENYTASNASTGRAVYDADFKYNPASNLLSVGSIKLNSGCTLQYDSTNQCVNFVFG